MSKNISYNIKPIIIHIGQMKTGTTHLQNLMANNCNMLSSIGIEYPLFCRSGNTGETGHHNLPRYFYERSSPPGSFFDERMGNPLEFLQFIRTTDRNKIVFITSEGFYPLVEKNNDDVFTFFRSIRKVRPLHIYVTWRNTTNWIESQLFHRARFNLPAVNCFQDLPTRTRQQVHHFDKTLQAIARNSDAHKVFFYSPTIVKDILSFTIKSFFPDSSDLIVDNLLREAINSRSGISLNTFQKYIIWKMVTSSAFYEMVSSVPYKTIIHEAGRSGINLNLPSNVTFFDIEDYRKSVMISKNFFERKLKLLISNPHTAKCYDSNKKISLSCLAASELEKGESVLLNRINY